MNIKGLKESIENNKVDSKGIIFKSKSTFIPTQYIYKIAQVFNKDIEYVDSISRIVKKDNSLFGNIERDSVCILLIDKIADKLYLDDFCYVICNECKNNDFVDVPKIEDWHILDFAITNSSKSIDQDAIRSLVEACGNDIYFVSNEISKYSIFSASNQKQIFKSLLDNNQLAKAYKDTIFDFTNAILDKNYDKIIAIYSNIENYSIDSMAVISIIRKQLKNIILVGFNKNPTEENTGLSSKQIYWIRKNIGKYNAQELIDNFIFINDVENLLKKGILSSSQLLDYVLVKLL